MNILEMVLKYDNHQRPEEVDFSVSELSGKSNYQLWLTKIGREKNYANDLDNSISAKLGTGFHLLAEEALMQSDLPKAWIEEMLIGEIEGYKVSGTPDIIYIDGEHTVVGDYKTKGNFQMKKTLTGDYRDIILQESLYAYLFAQQYDRPMPKVGEAYLVRVGDRGWWTKKEVEKYNLESGASVPNRHTERLVLLTKEEVEEFIRERMKAIEDEPAYDCATWMCGWCEFDCEFRL